MMRTTINIDDGLLMFAKGLAEQQRISLGKAISILIQKGLEPSTPHKEVRNGLRVISRRHDAKPVTLEIVNSLRDE